MVPNIVNDGGIARTLDMINEVLKK